MSEKNVEESLLWGEARAHVEKLALDRPDVAVDVLIWALAKGEISSRYGDPPGEPINPARWMPPLVLGLDGEPSFADGRPVMLRRADLLVISCERAPSTSHGAVANHDGKAFPEAQKRKKLLSDAWLSDYFTNILKQGDPIPAADATWKKLEREYQVSRVRVRGVHKVVFGQLRPGKR